MMAKKSKRTSHAKQRIRAVEQLCAMQENDEVDGQYILVRMEGQRQPFYLRLDQDEIEDAIKLLRKANDNYVGTLGHLVQMKR
jgi:hypothetical protein